MAKNPLSDLVPIEERADGVYCKIDAKDAARLTAASIVAALDNAQPPVLNYDAAKIKEVFTRAGGVFEPIGGPFEYYNEQIEHFAQVVVTPEKATVLLPVTIKDVDITISEQQLGHLLKRKGVRHGIDFEQLKTICSEGLFDEAFEVARSTPPVSGNDAHAEFQLAVSPDATPQLKEDGRVDYRDIRSFVSVVAGQVIVKKIPPTPGVPGSTVTGEAIPAAAGNDCPLSIGRNTELSADGSQVIASKSGIVQQDGPIISIIELLDIRGDVDFKVGNIKYRGDVLVRGSVMPGFIIEAEGSVHINGNVESARIISRDGDVCIEHGVFGKGDTFISGKKGVALAFAQEANVVSDGTVMVYKYLLNCDCTCRCMMTKDNNGALIGGHVRAEKSVTVGQLGSDKVMKTKITLFDKERKLLTDKLREVTDLEVKVVGQKEVIGRQLKAKSAKLSRYDGEEFDNELNEMKKWIDAYNTVNSKIVYVRQKKDELKKALETTRQKDPDGFIKVAKSAFPGTELELYEINYRISEIMVNTVFKVVKSDVTCSSIAFPSAGT
jgi:hypothetical protein